MRINLFGASIVTGICTKTVMQFANVRNTSTTIKNIDAIILKMFTCIYTIILIKMELVRLLYEYYMNPESIITFLQFSQIKKLRF